MILNKVKATPSQTGALVFAVISLQSEIAEFPFLCYLHRKMKAEILIYILSAPCQGCPRPCASLNHTQILFHFTVSSTEVSINKGST